MKKERKYCDIFLIVSCLIFLFIIFLSQTISATAQCYDCGGPTNLFCLHKTNWLANNCPLVYVGGGDTNLWVCEDSGTYRGHEKYCDDVSNKHRFCWFAFTCNPCSNPTPCDTGTICVARTTYYLDYDGDGYGNASQSVQACSIPNGYNLNNTDCNDNNAAVNPGAPEICNDLDDNCNSLIDEGLNCAVPQPPTIQNAHWANETGNTIQKADTRTKVNMTVIGVKFLGKNITYNIYNSLGNALIYSSEHTATEDSTDYINWIPSSTGIYYFNATLEGSQKAETSGYLDVSAATSLHECTTDKPENSYWNDIENPGYFMQTWNNSCSCWDPAEKNASHEDTTGECHFKCTYNYAWNGTNCNFIETNPCATLTEDECTKDITLTNKLYSNLPALSDWWWSEHNINCTENCIDCYCNWNSTESTCNPKHAQNNAYEGCTPGECEYSCELVKSNITNRCGTSSNDILYQMDWDFSLTGGPESCSDDCRDYNEGECCDSTRTYPCVSSGTELDFMTDFGLVLIILIIIAIYIYLRARLGKKYNPLQKRKKQK